MHNNQTIHTTFHPLNQFATNSCLASNKICKTLKCIGYQPNRMPTTPYSSHTTAKPPRTPYLLKPTLQTPPNNSLVLNLPFQNY